MIVHSGPFVTAGAALGHMDLALWLVRSVSPQLASLTAQYLIVDSRPSQSAYALTDHLVHADPLVRKFESWARANLARGFSLNAAARAVGSSKRTLARRLHAVLGKSPLEYCTELAGGAGRPSPQDDTSQRRRHRRTRRLRRWRHAPHAAPPKPSCRGQRDSRVRIAAKGPSPSVLPKRLDRFNRGSAPRGADRRTDTNDRNGQHGPDIRDPVGVRRSIQEMRHNP